MRVVSGEFGGRKLKTLPGKTTRPTTDKVKGAMFNMIGPYFSGGMVLDLFAGSGSLAIEAVSRGMDQAFLVEKNFRAMAVIKENVAMTKETERFHLMQMPANKAIQQLAEQKVTFDLILLDPPYAEQEIVKQLTALAQADLIAPGAVVVCETDKTIELPENIDQFLQRKRQVYGLSAVTIYDWEAE
ncbi:16S rRNA (guanine(966)-N(2))-methyltransferase RsmD [Enterococcus pallens]|uniref:RsmD family RNA methyltransferase n=1 Tax=Enterococcus pallens ATCC BAA-351 TaxID=1158607 RepID=R2SBE1_9ENTE|nr:16S rRNA (guanine(966)-N(2))-methyltransferase RsmD [Enterococcus pallens]EOH90171.1 RsmD family RNA methyltransferase [Enterococcus pallens ATCC BAA-351]EOU15223.1 RsmD family RNA methyltransferase [Enterococcus pallens ATCC BAA-351]OJG76811.1 RsmD family RNA methyltransferase [Enterococcus pallens]